MPSFAHAPGKIVDRSPMAGAYSPATVSASSSLDYSPGSPGSPTSDLGSPTGGGGAGGLGFEDTAGGHGGEGYWDSLGGPLTPMSADASAASEQELLGLGFARGAQSQQGGNDWLGTIE